MAMTERVEVGGHVLLTGQHPWRGYTGEVIERRAMTGVLIVRLDNGFEVEARPRQYKAVWR